MASKVDIEQSIADTIIERPHGFKVSGRSFYLYPVTLGKTYLLARLVESLEINEDIMKFNPYLEALRLAESKKDESLRIIAYYTAKNKDEVFDNDLILERIDFFKEKLDDEDIAQLLIIIFTETSVDEYIKHFRLDKEKEDMNKVMRCKKATKGSYTFGGKSIYGSMIDHLAQRYGWTMDYIVWVISFKNVQMLLADMVTTINLTDEEAKKCRVSNDRNFISGDDMNNIEKIKQMFGG